MKVNHWYGFRIPWFRFTWVDDINRTWKGDPFYVWYNRGLHIGPYPHTEN